MPEDSVIRFDYEAEGVAEPVKQFRPLIYQEDEKTVCVILGPDPQAGVFGCGCTVEEAVSDWVAHFKQVASHPGDDEVSRYITDTLNTHKEDVW